MKKDFVYLASASPRRSELLGQIGIPFRVRAAHIDERIEAGEVAPDYVVRMACAKAQRIWDEIAASSEPRPVLAADTVVVLDGRVLGKPSGAEDAERMLAALSARAHDVLTAVAVVYDDEVRSVLAASEVRFRATTAAERSAYCRTGEPFDKAGAYGIQGRAAVFVASLSGSYSAVMGLPLYETAALLARFGLPDWLADESI
jgi:septum formation protein